MSDVFSWKELATLPPRPNRDYVERGVLSPGNIWLIFAPQESFKSTVALNISKDLAEGRPVFGQLKPNKTFKVLYLDKELGFDWAKDRIEKMYNLNTDLIPSNLFIATKGQKPLDIALQDSITLGPLLKTVEKIEPEILVFDCLNPFLTVPESEEAFKGVEHSFNVISRKFPDIAFILLHHMREVRPDMDPLDIYNSRNSTKLTDMAAARMALRATDRNKKGDFH